MAGRDQKWIFLPHSQDNRLGTWFECCHLHRVEGSCAACPVPATPEPLSHPAATALCLLWWVLFHVPIAGGQGHSCGREPQALTPVASWGVTAWQQGPDPPALSPATSDISEVFLQGQGQCATEGHSPQILLQSHQQLPKQNQHERGLSQSHGNPVVTVAVWTLTHHFTFTWWRLSGVSFKSVSWFPAF